LHAVVINNTQIHTKALEQAEIFMRPRGGLRLERKQGKESGTLPPMRGAARPDRIGPQYSLAG